MKDTLKDEKDDWCVRQKGEGQEQNLEEPPTQPYHWKKHDHCFEAKERTLGTRLWTSSMPRSSWGTKHYGPSRKQNKKKMAETRHARERLKTCIVPQLSRYLRDRRVAVGEDGGGNVQPVDKVFYESLQGLEVLPNEKQLIDNIAQRRIWKNKTSCLLLYQSLLTR